MNQNDERLRLLARRRYPLAMKPGKHGKVVCEGETYVLFRGARTDHHERPFGLDKPEVEAGGGRVVAV